MNTSAAVQPERLAANDWAAVKLRCVRCTGSMGSPVQLTDLAVDRRECIRCASAMQAIDGIWRAIPPARARQLDAALTAYESVREKEGRWSDDTEFYRSLPWQDTTGHFAEQWRIRARSFDFVQKNVLPQYMKRMGKQRLRVLDLGAGNCWMSYRLALQGHFPIAIDLGVGRKDGLGAAVHYQSVLGQLFPRFQAEMGWLPFADGQFDLAIYNASFHYAQDYEAIVLEALRVLRPNGGILIVDSPTYRFESDGEAMKREKAAEFAGRFGTNCGGMGGQEYLTPERLAHLERSGIRWRRYSPWYGWRWAMRPIVARLAGRRRPSRFHIYLGSRVNYAAEAE
jgi:SAM-dependent methyltransferase